MKQDVRDSLVNGLLVFCIVVLIVGGLAMLTMGPEIKSAANAGCMQHGWRPVFAEPEPEQKYTWNHSITMENAMATRTGITTGLVIQCTMRMQCTGASFGQSMRFTPFTAAGLNYIDLQYGYSSGDEYHFYVDELPDIGQQNGTSIVVSEGDWIEVPITTTVTNLNFASTHTTDPIGEKGTTHAKECSLSEAWALTENTQVVVEVPGLDTMTYNWPEGQTFIIGTVLCDFTIVTTTNGWSNNTIHCEFTDISVGMIDIDTSRLDGTWGGSENLRVIGGGNNISFMKTADVGTSLRNHSEWINMPRAYSFAGLDVIDRDGNSYQDALVWNTGVREWDSEGEPICPVCKTVAQWQAYDHTQARGCYSWDTSAPDLNANVTLWIDRDWAREAGLDGFTGDEYATKSFGHDARIIIDGWTIDKTSRDCAPWRDDILSIAHKSSIGIYADDQDHTDWVSNGNCSNTDNDGDFTVTVAGAQQTFSLVNNREARLGGLVQALEAPAGVPDAYITYQHDYYYNADNYPEDTHESIYCWKGWRYLYFTIKPPYDEDGNTAQVTLEIDYYDSESHSDPHVSDSTRQTDYAYSLGKLKTATFTKSVPRTTLATNVCFDIGEYQPMYIVKTIRLKVNTIGDWAIGEPFLSLDAGDVLTEREAVTPHSYGKEFEHFGYCRGGVSAIVDGIVTGSMEWPDTSHENTIEHTGGHFDHVVGASSGIDMTSAASLATYASWMQQSSDAWNAEANASNEEDATSDGTNTLKTLSAYDVCPTNKQGLDSGSLRVAIRVGSFTAAPGIHYTFTAEKITGGAIHGCIFDDASRNLSAFTDVVRRVSDGEWETSQTDLNTNGHGYWSTTDKTVYVFTDGVGSLYSYGLQNEDIIKLMGRVATREWLYFDYDNPIEETGALAYVEHAPNITFLFIYDGEQIKHVYSSPPDFYYEHGITQSSYVLPRAVVTSTDGSPSGYFNASGKMYFYHMFNGSLMQLTSSNYGNTFDSEGVMISGESLTKGFTMHKDGISYAVCINSNSDAFFYRSNTHFADATWTTDVNKFLITTGCDDAQPSCYTHFGNIFAAIMKSGAEVIFKCQDGGKTWTEVT